MDTKPLSHHSLIISDLHLSDAEPWASELFFKFMSGPAKSAEAVYILGDFFATWIGDDDLTPYHQTIIQALKSLSDSGIKVYFMAGNRDFLVGTRFSELSGATLLTDPWVVNFYGTDTLLMHGDTLCTDDHAYLRFRRIVHQRWLQGLFLCLPLHWRRTIAKKMRAKSRGSVIYQDVNPHAVICALQQHQVKRLIHGHTHRFALHCIKDDCQRIVLGAWHEHGSYIDISPQGISLKHFS